MKINYKVKNIIPLLQLNVEDIPKVGKRLYLDMSS